MLPERCIIEDVHKATVNNSDSDATQRKRRSYGDQVVLCVRRDVARSLADHFSPTPARETVRDMIIIQAQGGGAVGGGGWFGDVIRRLEVNVMKVLYVLECNVAFDDLHLLVAAPLRVLVLSDCNLRALPCRVFEILTLEVLKIDRNCIEEIPEELGNLCRLRTFCCDAQRPRLKSLPQTISRLERLEILSFCDNRVASIAWAATLPNLRVLRCASNRVEVLPSQLVNLSQLTWLDVSHNPIEHVPRALEPLVARLYRFDYVNRRLQPRSARRFKSALTSHLKLENLLAATTTVAVDTLLRSYVNDVTIVVLGETGSGKSTLLQALKDERGLCRQQEARNRFHPLEIHRFDMTHTGAALANGSCDSARPTTGTPSSGESSRVNFSLSDDVHASCYVTGIAFSGEYLDNYTRDVHADLYLVLLDLTTLEQHQMGSPPHLLVRHLARLQMWLQAAYEMSPTTPVLIVGTHAELVKAVTFHDVCGLLDELLAGGRQNHVRRFSDDVSRNCVLCNQRALATGHAATTTLSKSKSGQSWFMDQSSSPTAGLNPHRTNGKRASSVSPPETLGTPTSSSSAATGKSRFPHVVGYQEVDCKKCFPRDTKKVNVSVDQLKAAILRLAECRHRIPADWLAFNRQLVGLGEQTHGVPCLSYEDAVSVARNFEISVSLVPTILHYFHRRGSLVFFPGEPVLSRIVIVSPVWLLETLERALSAQADARTDSLRLHQNHLSDRELERLFLKARIHELNGAQWLAAVAERLECCAALWPSIVADPRKHSSSFFFPRLLRFGSPALDIWPETPEPDDRQVAYDVTVRNVRPRMFQEFLLTLNDDGRRILEILPTPVPVYLSHQAVFFSALDNGACDDCRGCGGDESNGRRGLSPQGIEGLSDARTNDILHKVHFVLRADHSSIRVTVRGPRPCCVVKSTLRFLEQRLNDVPEDECSDLDPDGSGGSFRSCSCASEDESVGCFRDGGDDDRSALCRLLCPKCVLLRDANPDRISAQTMNSRNRAVCNRWHNLGSWSRAVTGDYQIAPHPRPFCLSSGVGLPDYEHPRLAMLLPPSTAMSQREWQATGRAEFLEGYEVQFLCENFTYWHLTDGAGVRLRSHLSSDESSSHVLSAVVALAIPMVHLVLGIGEHPTTPRLLAPVVSDLLQMYDYLRIVDVSTQDPYAWLLRYKDRLVAMLARVLANVSSVDGGPQQHPDVFIKGGTALGPGDLLQSATVFSREDLGRFLQLETSSSRFGCLRPIYSGKEIRWVCEAHYEEFRTTHPSIHFNS